MQVRRDVWMESLGHQSRSSGISTGCTEDRRTRSMPGNICNADQNIGQTGTAAPCFGSVSGRRRRPSRRSLSLPDRPSAALRRADHREDGRPSCCVYRGWSRTRKSSGSRPGFSASRVSDGAISAYRLMCSRSDWGLIRPPGALSGKTAMPVPADKGRSGCR